MRQTVMLYATDTATIVIVTAGMTKAQAIGAIARGWEAGNLVLVVGNSVYTEAEDNEG